jgi:hypothetical protein
VVLPDAIESNVVLEILSDARKMFDNRDSQSLQFSLVTNSGLHEHFGVLIAASDKTTSTPASMCRTAPTERIPHCRSQSASAFRSRVKVGKLRTGWGITISADCNQQVACAYIDAGCIGCKMGNRSHRFIGSLRHWLLRGPAGCPKARTQANSQSRSSSKLTSVITHLYPRPAPRFSSRF